MPAIPYTRPTAINPPPTFFDLVQTDFVDVPANFLHLYDRGRIAPGLAADLLVFDPDTVQDTATFAKPLSFPTGMPYVIVSGRAAIDDGRFTAVNAGSVLRHNGKR